MMIFVDFSGFLYSSFYIANKKCNERQKDLEKTDIMESLFTQLNKLFSVYGKCYIVMDGKNGNEWRRKIYPEYKKNRVRSDNIELLHSCRNEIESLLSFYPVKNIKVENAEADDCFYFLCEKYQKENKLILSSDNDLSQLLNYFDNLEIYDLFRKKYIKKDSLIIEKKMIIGDPSDNIPGISRVGKITFNKMLEDKELYKDKTKNNEVLLEKFRKIIDLRLSPKFIKKELLKEDEKDYNKYEPEEIEYFFFNKKHKRLLDTWCYYSSNIKVKVNG